MRSTSELAPVHYSFLRGAVRQSERLFVDLELRIGHPLLHSQVVLDFVRHSRLCGYAAESGPRLVGDYLRAPRSRAGLTLNIFWIGHWLDTLSLHSYRSIERRSGLAFPISRLTRPWSSPIPMMRSRRSVQENRIRVLGQRISPCQQVVATIGAALNFGLPDGTRAGHPNARSRTKSVARTGILHGDPIPWCDGHLARARSSSAIPVAALRF